MLFRPIKKIYVVNSQDALLGETVRGVSGDFDVEDALRNDQPISEKVIEMIASLSTTNNIITSH